MEAASDTRASNNKRQNTDKEGGLQGDRRWEARQGIRLALYRLDIQELDP